MSYLTINTKQRRKKTPQQTALSIQREIEETLRIKQEQSNNTEYRLISVLTKNFIYEMLQGNNSKRFKVPYTTSSAGGLVLDFAEQSVLGAQQNNLQINKIKEDQKMRIFRATDTSEIEYKKRMNEKGQTNQSALEDEEMMEVLLPARIIQANTKEEDGKQLQTLQEQAERDGLLLPTQFNRSITSRQAPDESEILMPAGF